MSVGKNGRTTGNCCKMNLAITNEIKLAAGKRALPVKLVQVCPLDFILRTHGRRREPSLESCVCV